MLMGETGASPRVNEGILSSLSVPSNSVFYSMGSGVSSPKPAKPPKPTNPGGCGPGKGGPTGGPPHH